MKIFLADLVHTWEKVGLWTMPLNIGFIGSYAKSQVPEISDVKLFKRPERIIEEIKADPPDVLGLSFYVWNTNPSSHIADIARKANPEVLIVGGGPQFTSINATEAKAPAFFKTHSSLDAYVINQGEREFVEILNKFIECGRDVSALRKQTIAGSMINSGDGKVLIGESLDVIRDLDEIPSPYLTGMLDEFFDEPFNPMIETNRSCPYRCTFCAWGIGTTKLSRFGNERVLEEIDYISERCTKATILHVCDANFAILERDADFATRMYQAHKNTGFPGRVALQ